MADVLIVCVREDEPQAKALADMFEAAGFSIGGAPSNDGALRSSGAGVVVWSQASIRSRPFLDAAQRVINAGKAVVASLIEPPPASSIGNSAAFDLSHWDGDPNDPSLDPLFFAVDRMVNAARAQVGAATAPIADPQTYEAPVPRAPARPTTPPPSASSYRAPAHADEELGSETEYWRAIRDSRDPSDFMDYLARFGPDGAFSEVAELRLKQLSEKARAPARRPAPPAPGAMPSSRAPRAEPPPRAEAPSRRYDPPPPRRAEAPRRGAPAFDRSFDRPPADLSEPPPGQSGMARTMILVGVLAIALAAGLYFGGALDGLLGRAQQQQAASTEADSTATPATNSDEPDDYNPESFIFNEGPETRAGPVVSPSRREPASREETQRAAREPTQTQRTAAPAPARQATEPPPPAPTTSWAGGPVSLNPGQASEPQQTQVASAEPDVTAPTLPTPAATTPARTPTPTLSWSQRPSARRISDLYPSRALSANVSGRVQLDCAVMANLSVSCAVASETPTGMGFGRAALSAASSYRAQPFRSDGSSAIGARTRLVINFQIPE
jgi:outer membrane biosynthesis protein TonB